MNKALKEKIAILSISLVLTSTYAISASVTYMEDAFNIQKSMAESLITLPSVMVLIVTLFSEAITNKIGIKRCVLLGLSFVTASGILPSAFQSLNSIIASRILLGIGIGLLASNSANYINIFYKGRERERLHGIRSSMEFIGQITLLFIAGIIFKYSWIHAFLIYSLAIFILIFFNKNIKDVDFSETSGKIKINKNVVFFILIAAFAIMNITAANVRLPSIAKLNNIDATSVSFYLIIISIVGMICGFFFGKFYNTFKKKSMVIGLCIYIVTNILIAFSKNNFYLFFILNLFMIMSQSLIVIPYLFANVGALVGGGSQSFATSLIFAGCNLGSGVSAFFLDSVAKILHTNSLTLPFSAFSLFYFILLIIFIKTMNKKNTN